MKPKFTVSEWVKNNLKRSHKIEVSKFSNLLFYLGNFPMNRNQINLEFSQEIILMIILMHYLKLENLDFLIGNFFKRKLMISTENPGKLHEALEGIFRYSALLMSLSGFALFEFGHFILLALPSAGSSRDA